MIKDLFSTYSYCVSNRSDEIKKLNDILNRTLMFRAKKWRIKYPDNTVSEWHYTNLKSVITGKCGYPLSIRSYYKDLKTRYSFEINAYSIITIKPTRMTIQINACRLLEFDLRIREKIKFKPD